MWDIGIPGFLEPEPDLWVVTEDDVNIPGRRVDDHKYRAGYVAVLAGSKAYPGAAWLASQAAYRTGAGYVRLLMPAGAAESVRSRLVETVLEEIGDGDFLDDAGRVLAAVGDERLGALVCGPGLGRDPATAAAVRQVVLQSAVPCVLDADGLFAFAGQAEALKGRSGLVLTPHVGELAALLGEHVADVAKEHLAAARRAAAATGQVVLLKGSSTHRGRPVRGGPRRRAGAAPAGVRRYRRRALRRHRRAAGQGPRAVRSRLRRRLAPRRSGYAGRTDRSAGTAGRRPGGTDPRGHRRPHLREETFVDELKVREIMTSPVITVKPETTVRELADILAQNKISGVPVVDAEDRMLGMVSEADVIVQDADLHFPYYIQFLESVIYLQSVHKFEERFRKAFGSKVSEIMTEDVISVSPDADRAGGGHADGGPQCQPAAGGGGRAAGGHRDPGRYRPGHRPAEGLTSDRT